MFRIAWDWTVSVAPPSLGPMSDTRSDNEPAAAPTFRYLTQDVLGGPEVLHLATGPRPTPGPTDVLVRIHAAGVNPTDWKHRQAGRFLGQPPFTLGWDVSGVVESVGLGVAIHKPGDEVFGVLRYPFGAGAYAEYIAAPARTFVAKPQRLSHLEAGAVPLAAMTAWQALVDVSEVGEGDRVLIHAGAGGVGHFAIQIAKARGATVYATASEPKHELLRSWGADEVIDYRTVDFTTVIDEVDAVLDPIGGDYGPRSARLIARGGHGSIVSLAVANIDPRLAQIADERGVRSEVILVEPDHDALSQIAELIDDGKISVHLDGVFDWTEAGQAHEVGERDGTTGKLVLQVVPD